MKLRPSRWVTITIAILVAVTLFFAASYHYITRTPAGLQLVWRIVDKYIPGTISVQNLQGTLHDHISFTDFDYEIDGTTILIAHGNVKADIFALLRKKIIIRDLKASNVEIDIPPANPDAPPSTFTTDDLLDIFAMIRIDKANVEKLEVTRTADTLFQADLIQVDRNLDGSNQLVIKSSNGNVAGSVNFNMENNREWNIALTGDNVNGKLISKDLDSNLKFDLSTNGIWNRSTKKYTLNIPNISGYIKKHAVNVTGIVSYDEGKLQIDEAIIHFADAKAIVNGSINNHWNLQWSVDVPNFKNILPDLGGSLKSNGTVKFINNYPSVSASLVANNLQYDKYKISKINGIISSQKNPKNINAALSIKNTMIEKITLPDVELTINSQLERDSTNVNSIIVFDKNNSIYGTLKLAPLKAIDDNTKKIDGKYNLKFGNLTLFNRILEKIPQIKNVTGQIIGTATINGTLAKPVFAADVTLKNGSLLVPLYNTHFTNIALDVGYKVNEPLKLNGDFNLGKGHATVMGTTDFKNGIDSSIAIKGTDLQVTNTAEYKIQANPDFIITYNKNALGLSGNIDIPYGLITPTNFSTVATLPSDVIIVNDPVANQTPMDLSLALTINLSDKIKVKYQDLESNIKGQLKIFQTPGTPPTGTGELQTFNGTYKAYGRELTIETGRLTYAGNVLTNPGMDVRAIQTFKTVGTATDSQYSTATPQNSFYTGSQEITVGVMIRGTLKKPVMTLFSEPAGMRQDDILSYLILGQPRSQASGANSLAILNMAASQYGGGGTGDFTSNIQDKLGLTDLSVGSTQYFDKTNNTAQSQTTVNVGKDLGHNLSVHYNVGSSVSIFNLRYTISRHFAFQTETSTLENGADLLYQIESAD